LGAAAIRPLSPLRGLPVRTSARRHERRLRTPAGAVGRRRRRTTSWRWSRFGS